jgi:hypothetical protein
MAQKPACAVCRWCRVVPGPTPDSPGPYLWCGNVHSAQFAYPISEGFGCEKFDPGRPLPRVSPQKVEQH